MSKLYKNKKKLNLFQKRKYHCYVGLYTVLETIILDYCSEVWACTTVFQCSTWPPFTAVIEANRLQKCLIARYEKACYIFCATLHIRHYSSDIPTVRNNVWFSHKCYSALSTSAKTDSALQCQGCETGIYVLRALWKDGSEWRFVMWGGIWSQTLGPQTEKARFPNWVRVFLTTTALV